MSGFYAGGRAYNSAVKALNDGITASQCGQRADGVKGVAIVTQPLPAAFQLTLHQLQQTLTDMPVAGVEVADALQRLMTLQSGMQAVEQQASLLQLLFDAALQALLQFIQALRLLYQLLPRVLLLQAFTQPAQGLPLCIDLVLKQAAQAALIVSQRLLPL